MLYNIKLDPRNIKKYEGMDGMGFCEHGIEFHKIKGFIDQLNKTINYAS
jgi:hypothetical protein